jgi:hypothetical protein
MVTIDRPRNARRARQSCVERSRNGFLFSIPNHHNRTVRFELTRKQAQQLEERLSRELHRVENGGPTAADDEWLDPQIL